MNTFLAIMAAHLTTTGLGVLYVRRTGVTPAKAVALAAWAVLFFPVAFNVVKFL